MRRKKAKSRQGPSDSVNRAQLRCVLGGEAELDFVGSGGFYETSSKQLGKRVWAWAAVSDGQHCMVIEST